jgi:hypothetical protein
MVNGRAIMLVGLPKPEIRRPMGLCRLETELGPIPTGLRPFYVTLTSEMARSRTDIMASDQNDVEYQPMAPTLTCVVIDTADWWKLLLTRKSILRLYVRLVK